MSKKREIPEVNAGSMADIAFLLLIFFLVTTTIETDAGLNRKLPITNDNVRIQERNLFRVNLNASNALLVEEDLLPIKDLRAKAIAFLDNGGISSGNGYCNYCKGKRDALSSDNPTKAVISLSNARGADYGTYVAVQNELVAAYTNLRDREATRLYGITYAELLEAYNNPEVLVTQKKELNKKITLIRNLYPQKISEAEIDNK